MGLLKPATKGSYLKAGFLGFAGAGKTYTAVLLAIGTRKLFGLPGAIAMFDTERGSDDIEDLVEKETGTKLLVAKRRSLVDLMNVARECESGGVSVLVVDSITHVWREVTESYQKEKKKRGQRDRLEFQDWGRIKSEWQQWPDWFLNSAMHVIVCGRAGWDYETQENDDGKKEMIKSGVKMKAEGEFGFEPGLVVEMQRDFATDRKGRLSEDRNVINRALVLKDRKRVLDGRACEDPSFEFFRPHVERLLGGEHVAVDTTGRTAFELDSGGRDRWQRERESREILTGEIKGALLCVWPGDTRDEKREKVSALSEFWGVKSWEAIEKTVHSVELRNGLDKFCAKYADKMPPTPSTTAPAMDEMPEWAQTADERAANGGS